jgi:hypothetical protein
MMRPMKGWTSFLLLALAACSAGDDVADGTRDLCAEGGELNACSSVPGSPREACWRLVDCGAIPLQRGTEDYEEDWDRCVRDLEDMPEASRRLVIGCIGASTCDQLRLDNDACFRFGDN